MNQVVEKQSSHKSLVMKLSLMAVFMLGFGFAMVPLYNVLCSALGLNGKTGGAVPLAVQTVDKSRTITIEFFTTTNDKLPWKFYPIVRELKVHPGKNYRVAFYAENDTDKPMVIQAIPSVAPGYAAKYLKKTECFCFEQQHFKAHESMKMPLLFHIDRDLPKNIRRMTLSYTLFDAGKFVKKRSG